MNKIWHYLSQTIIHPAKTFKQLLADLHHLLYGTQEANTSGVEHIWGKEKNT